MAIRPDLLAVAHTPQKPTHAPEKHGKPGDKPRTGWQAEFNKNSFVNLGGSDLSLDRQRRPEGTQKEGKAVFNEHIRAQYRSFLHNYVGRLLEVTTADRSLVLGETDRRLVSLLTKAVERTDASTIPLDPINSPTNIGAKEVDVERIDDFLNGENPENWTLANLALEQYIQDSQAAVGLMVSETPQGDRSVWINDHIIHLGIGQGMVNKVWHRVAEWGGVPLNTTGGRPDDPRTNPLIANINKAQVVAGTAALSVAGALPGFLAGPAVAVAGALIGPTAVGLFHASRGGVTFDINHLGATFGALQRNPNRLRLMAKMTQIDLNRYEYVNGHMVLRAGQEHLNLKGTQQVLEDALTLMYTRQEFLTTLGIPYERIDASPEQFLTQVQNNTDFALLLEQTGLKVNSEIMERFIAAGGVNPDLTISLDHWHTAREQVMAHKLTDKISAAERENQRQGTISNLETSKANIAEVKKKRTEEIGGRKTALDEEATRIGTLKGSVETYNRNLANFRNERGEEGRDHAETLRTQLARVPNPAGGTFDRAQPAIAALDAVLNGAGTITIDGRPIASIPTRRADAQSARAVPFRARDMTGGETVQQYDHASQVYRQELKEAFDEERRRWEADATLIDQVKNQLTAASAPVRTELPPDLNQTNEAVAAVGRAFERNFQDFNAIIEMDTTLIVAGNPGVGLTEEALRTETVDQILQRVNRAHQANNTLGWAENQNVNKDLRARIVNAMTEARARNLAGDALRFPSVNYVLLTEEEGWGISEHQLLASASEQIRDLLVARRAENPVRYAGATTPLFTLNQIRDSVAQAQRIFSARSRAVGQMETDLKLWSSREDQAEKSIDTTETETRYDLAIRLMKGETEPNGKVKISGRERLAREAVVIQNDPARFFDATPIGGADVLNFLDAERERSLIGPPAPGVVMEPFSQGYVRLMDKIFSHRTGTVEEQNKKFRAAVELMPPAVLAQILDERVMGGGLPAGYVPDINAALAGMNGLVTAGMMDAIGIQEIFEDIVQRVAAETRLRSIAI